MKHSNLFCKKSFHIWITTIHPKITDGVIKRLVEKGYSVAAADGKDVVLNQKNFKEKKSPSVLIVMRVARASDNFLLTSNEVYNDIIFILEEIKAQFYSVIVSEKCSQSVWHSYNFKTDERD